MALNRRSGQRFQASIWPGFVDAMTALLLVLIFVLTIFMVVQSIQTETITGQESELDRLSQEIGSLATALGAEQQRNFELDSELGLAREDLTRARETDAFQSRIIDTLTAEMEGRNADLAAARGRITAFEAQVSGLLADRAAAQEDVATLRGQVETLDSRRDALETALATARDEIDAEQEAARLAAARRDALQAMIADLETERSDQDAALALVQADLQATEAELTEQEAARIVEAEAARRLRGRLETADAELTAMSLALEAQRQAAEDTLTLLAASRAAQEDLDARLMAALVDGEQAAEASQAARSALAEARARLAEEGESADALRQRLADAVAAQRVAEAGLGDALTEQERQAALLAQARATFSELSETSAQDRRRLAALNAQIAEMRGQLGELQSLLNSAAVQDTVAEVQIEALGARLNAALARVASEERQRAELEAAERRRLEQEAQRLENFRSEFFGQLRAILGDQDGVRIVGDRFVFSSEVLFDSGSATLSPAGRADIANVARRLEEVARNIPESIDWVIRVDGHTDNVPVSGAGPFEDNWDLSQARALSVVRYMIDTFGFPPDRLAATGFAEFQPIDPRSTPEARARNRRIELKLTER